MVEPPRPRTLGARKLDPSHPKYRPDIRIRATDCSAVELGQVGSESVCKFVDLPPPFVGYWDTFGSTLRVAAEFDFSWQRDLFDLTTIGVCHRTTR